MQAVICSDRVKRTIKVWAALPVCVWVFAGCSSTTSQSEQEVDREIAAAAGKQVQVSPAALRVTLRLVPEDSRCPTRVTCVWAGNARASFEAVEGEQSASFELNTTVEPRSANVLGYRITLVELTPIRALPEDEIPQARYEARLRIVRLGR
ncbi:MAG: hypothetical protein ACT4OZ_01530 [Gemmatimonadota bacterium]